MEGYAHSLELDVWTSSTVTKASQDPETKKWTVEIDRTNAESCSFVVNHLVFAVGFGGGTPNVPQIPGAVGANFLRTVYFSITPSVI
jgi:cation diffusion facilitator CzcD-associated flavoprotein CzcO